LLPFDTRQIWRFGVRDAKFCLKASDV